MGNFDVCSPLELGCKSPLVPVMQLVSNTRRYATAVPLRNAVLCVDCESVSGARFDKCPVCGSASVFSIAPMLGGSLATSKRRAPEAQGGRFNVAIRIALEEIEGKEVSAALSGITELLELRIPERRAWLHVDVQPVANEQPESAPKAA